MSLRRPMWMKTKSWTSRQKSSWISDCVPHRSLLKTTKKKKLGDRRYSIIGYLRVKDKRTLSRPCFRPEEGEVPFCQVTNFSQWWHRVSIDGDHDTAYPGLSVHMSEIIAWFIRKLDKMLQNEQFSAEVLLKLYFKYTNYCTVDRSCMSICALIGTTEM